METDVVYSNAHTRLKPWQTLVIIAALLPAFISLIFGLSLNRKAQILHAPETRAAQTITATYESGIATYEAGIIHLKDPVQVKLIPIFSKESGSLDMKSGIVDTYCADVDVYNFAMEATFHNPYSQSKGIWSNGFFFRYAGSNNQYRLMVFSDGVWKLVNATSNNSDTKFDLIAKGNVNVNTEANATNKIKLIAFNNKGYLYVNNTFITSIDLDDRQNSGDVCVATGSTADSKIEGYSTEYIDFTVWIADYE